MARTRVIRIAGAVLLGGVVAWTIAPYATNYVSSGAVINAPLVPLVSPIEGRIVEPSPAVATQILPGAPIVEIESDRPDRRALVALEGRETMLAERIESLKQREAELRRTADELGTRVARYRDGILDRLAAERREIAAEAAGVRARLHEAEETLGRDRTLHNRGIVAQARLESSQAMARTAEAELDRLSARLQRLAVETDAAEDGSYVIDGWNDVPYSMQRLDEVELRRAELAAERRSLESEHRAVSQEIDAELKALERTHRFAPLAMDRGVVWKASGAVGDRVMPGDEVLQLVDCRNRFIEVAVSERHFDSIQPGANAQVRLKGGGWVFDAEVTAVRGSGARAEHPRLAASVPTLESGQLRVLVSLEDVGLPRDPSAFCHVGRTAEVRFARKGLDLGVRLGALVDAIVDRVSGFGGA